MSVVFCINGSVLIGISAGAVIPRSYISDNRHLIISTDNALIFIYVSEVAIVVTGSILILTNSKRGIFYRVYIYP